VSKPAYSFDEKSLIADYKTVLDQFISSINYLIREIELHGVLLFEVMAPFENLAETILVLEEKTNTLLNAPLPEDIVYDVQTVKDILCQEIISKKQKTSLHAAAEQYQTKDHEILLLKEILKCYAKKPNLLNRLIETLDHISHDFYDYLRL